MKPYSISNPHTATSNEKVQESQIDKIKDLVASFNYHLTPAQVLYYEDVDNLIPELSLTDFTGGLVRELPREVFKEVCWWSRLKMNHTMGKRDILKSLATGLVDTFDPKIRFDLCIFLNEFYILNASDDQDKNNNEDDADLLENKTS